MIDEPFRATLRWDDVHGEYNFGAARRWWSQFAEIEPPTSYPVEPTPQYVTDGLVAAHRALEQMLWEERWMRWADWQAFDNDKIIAKRAK